MTLPSNPTLNAQTAAIEADKWAYSIYNEVNAMKQACIAGSIGLQDVVAGRLQALINYKPLFDAEIAKSGVDVAYATRYANKTFTFSTDSAAFSAGVQTLIDYIVTTIPADGVWLNTMQFADLTPGSEDYTLVQRQVTGGAALAAFQAQCQSVLDLIDVS